MRKRIYTAKINPVNRAKVVIGEAHNWAQAQGHEHVAGVLRHVLDGLTDLPLNEKGAKIAIAQILGWADAQGHEYVAAVLRLAEFYLTELPLH
jgi:hypothetical protein